MGLLFTFADGLDNYLSSLSYFSRTRQASAWRVLFKTHFNAPNSAYLFADDKLYYPAAKVPQISRNGKINSKTKNFARIIIFFLEIKK